MVNACDPNAWGSCIMKSQVCAWFFGVNLFASGEVNPLSIIHRQSMNSDTSQPPLPPMPRQILPPRPQFIIDRRDNPPPGKRQQKPRHILVRTDLTRHNDAVPLRHPHHPLVERPVAELAQRHAVADIIIAAHAPRHNVGRIDHGMAFRRDNPHPAQRAPMIIRGDHGPPEPLVPHNRPVHLSIENFLHPGLMGQPHQFQVVGICFRIDARLFAKRRLGLPGKAGLHENLPQGGAAVRLLEKEEQILIDPCPERQGPELTDAADAFDVLQLRLFARQRHEFPEWFVLQMKERIRDAAGLSDGHNPSPIAGEELVQLHQVAGYLDEIRRERAPRDQVQKRQQQNRLVRRALFRCRGPTGTGCTAQIGKQPKVFFKSRHDDGRGDPLGRPILMRAFIMADPLGRPNPCDHLFVPDLP